jgi:acetolactate synthase-1/2/3 large subunit
MELDTAVRHQLLLCVISLSGGWTADPEGNKPGRYLGYRRHDKMAEALGCYAEYVEEPEAIRPALPRTWKKVEKGMVGYVNVKTDYRARATTVRFFRRETFSGTNGSNPVPFPRESVSAPRARAVGEECRISAP